jgi:two-component system chemotaxis response regulator CheY
MKILSVDDDRINRFLIRKILVHEFNAEVIEAEDGFKALDILNGESLPDLAILDLMMPGMDGIQLLERIRMNYSLRRMKIIMCSALNERSRIAQAYALEIQDYILKPVQKEKITKAVKMALHLNADPATAKTATDPAQTDLQVYMSQLSQMALQTDGYIQRMENSASIGDRSSIADSMKAIVQAARRLGINKLANLADKLADQVFHCTEVTLANGIKSLKDEQEMINKTVTGVVHERLHA